MIYTARWVLLGLLDECRHHALGSLVFYFDQRNVTRMTLHQCCNIAVVRTGDQITFPMSWDSSVLSRSRSLADADGMRYLASPIFNLAGMDGSSHRTF